LTADRKVSKAGNVYYSLLAEDEKATGANISQLSAFQDFKLQVKDHFWTF
jgi:hypothetical protein